jgi:hypothetical protein
VDETVTDLVAQARAAIEARDWATARVLLHPYLAWTDADGSVLRGRRNVLARLEQTGPPGRPAVVELRDGQIYRWRA